MSAAGRALSKALDRPGEWEVPDRFRIRHKPSKLAFWVDSGAFFFDGDELEGTLPCLGLIERHWLYAKAMRVVRHQGAAQVVERFKKASA